MRQPAGGLLSYRRGQKEVAAQRQRTIAGIILHPRRGIGCAMRNICMLHVSFPIRKSSPLVMFSGAPHFRMNIALHSGKNLVEALCTVS